MRKPLPRFVTLNHPDLPQTLVMETRPPFILGAPYCVPKKDTEKVEDTLSKIANGRLTAVKMQGFTIFFFLWGSLQNSLPDSPEQARDILREMAGYYRENVISKNRHKHRIYEEGGPDDIDEQRGKYFKELKSKRQG